MLKSLTTANYDEAFGFNYRSIAGYTSSPDDNQRDFLEHLGYRKCGENMNITNASIIGADSLLSVKYILSPYRINGLQKISSIKSKGRKKAYRNPYALPFALIYPDHHPDLTEKKQIQTRKIRLNIRIIFTAFYTDRISPSTNLFITEELP